MELMISIRLSERCLSYKSYLVTVPKDFKGKIVINILTSRLKICTLCMACARLWNHGDIGIMAMSQTQKISLYNCYSFRIKKLKRFYTFHLANLEICHYSYSLPLSSFHPCAKVQQKVIVEK